jgi:hypothetical protein
VRCQEALQASRESSLESLDAQSTKSKQAKYAIGTVLSTLKGVQVRVESIIVDTNPRDDIRNTRSRTNGLSRGFDISLVPLAS